MVAMHRQRLCMHLSGIADTAAAIFGCVGIDALAIASGPGHPNAVILARHRGEVADDDGKLVRIAAAAEI